MNKLFSHPLRSSLIAAGLVAMLAPPVAAGPMPQPLAVAPPTDITQVRAEWAGDGKSPKTRRWIQRHGKGHHWRHNRHGRHDSWRYRHRPRHHSGSGIFLGLGLLPSYNYYVAPRRHYRSGSSAHVRWCYDRYRSYRASDNSWQPYHGPRRQCNSPYD